MYKHGAHNVNNLFHLAEDIFREDKGGACSSPFDLSLAFVKQWHFQEFCSGHFHTFQLGISFPSNKNTSSRKNEHILVRLEIPWPNKRGEISGSYFQNFQLETIVSFKTYCVVT